MAKMPEEISDIIQSQENEIDDLLSDTVDEFDKSIGRTQRDWTRLETITAIIFAGFIVALLEIIKSHNLRLSTEILAVAESETRQYMKTMGKKANEMLNEYISTARKGVIGTEKEFMARTYAGKTIEYRMARVKDGATKTVRNIIRIGVDSGKSSAQIASDIEQYIRPTERLLRVSPLEWYRQRFESYKVKDLSSIPAGSVSYNAYMIARTETTRTYRDRMLEVNEGNPVVYGYKWNLSGSHPKPDICDVWATQDNGMGEGVYDAGSLPSDHPNGMCYITTVVIEKPAFRKYLKTGERPEVPRFIGTVPNMKDWLAAKKGTTEKDAINKLLNN